MDHAFCLGEAKDRSSVLSRGIYSPRERGPFSAQPGLSPRGPQGVGQFMVH